MTVSDDLTIPTPVYRGARRSRPQGDPVTRRTLMIAGVLGVSLAVILGASTLFHRHAREVPVVQADTRPIRVKPDNPGGLQVPSANNEVFSGGSDTDGSKLSAAPEVPNPAAMRAAPPQPATVTTVAPPVAVEPPKVPRTTRVETEPSHAAPARVSADLHPAPAVAQARGVVVQLAALTSEDAAKTEWQHLSKRMPDLLGSHQPNYSRTDRDGHIFWRLRTAGFADAAQARSFCEQVHAKGGNCSVADF